MQDYFINLNTKKIHFSKSTDKRCQVRGMGAERIIYFSSLEAAKNYPDPERHLAELCVICRNKYFKE